MQLLLRQEDKNRVTQYLCESILRFVLLQVLWDVGCGGGRYFNHSIYLDRFFCVVVVVKSFIYFIYHENK